MKYMGDGPGVGEHCAMGAVEYHGRPVGDYLVFHGQGKCSSSAILIDGGFDIEASGFLETTRV